MDFTWKARFVSNGYSTPITSATTYAEVLSRETVSVAFTYTAFNVLDPELFEPPHRHV